jgi:hypothetical protein
MRIARAQIGPERSALLDRVIADRTPYDFFSAIGKNWKRRFVQ